MEAPGRTAVAPDDAVEALDCAVVVPDSTVRSRVVQGWL